MKFKNHNVDVLNGQDALPPNDMSLRETKCISRTPFLKWIYFRSLEISLFPTLKMSPNPNIQRPRELSISFSDYAMVYIIYINIVYHISYSHPQLILEEHPLKPSQER